MSEVPLRKRVVSKARDIRHNLSARVFGSRYYEKEWSERGKDQLYWESIEHPHRELLIASISKYNPDSALEIGCNTGPNLYRLAKRFSDAKLHGLDISKSAIEEGKRLFIDASIENVALEVGQADNLSAFGDKSFDVVFCDAVLIYIGKDKIDRVIDEMIRVAKKAIVLVEWHDSNSSPQGKFLYKKGYWARDYVSLLKRKKRTMDLKLQKITRDIWNDDYWSEYGQIIEVPLKND